MCLNTSGRPVCQYPLAICALTLLIINALGKLRGHHYGSDFHCASNCVAVWLYFAGSEEHVMLQYFSSRAIRRLVLNTGQNTQDAAFPKLLWQAAFKGRCQQWLGTHAEKIMAALASCKDASVKDALNSELQPILKRGVADWAAEFVSHGKTVARASKEKKGGQQGKKGPAT